MIVNLICLIILLFAGIIANGFDVPAPIGDQPPTLARSDLKELLHVTRESLMKMNDDIHLMDRYGTRYINMWLQKQNHGKKAGAHQVNTIVGELPNVDKLLSSDVINRGVENYLGSFQTPSSFLQVSSTGIMDTLVKKLKCFFGGCKKAKKIVKNDMFPNEPDPYAKYRNKTQPVFSYRDLEQFIIETPQSSRLDGSTILVGGIEPPSDGKSYIEDSLPKEDLAMANMYKDAYSSMRKAVTSKAKSPSAEAIQEALAQQYSTNHTTNLQLTFVTGQEKLSNVDYSSGPNGVEESIPLKLAVVPKNQPAPPPAELATLEEDMNTAAKESWEKEATPLLDGAQSSKGSKSSESESEAVELGVAPPQPGSVELPEAEDGKKKVPGESKDGEQEKEDEKESGNVKDETKATKEKKKSSSKKSMNDSINPFSDVSKEKRKKAREQAEPNKSTNDDSASSTKNEKKSNQVESNDCNTKTQSGKGGKACKAKCGENKGNNQKSSKSSSESQKGTGSDCEDEEGEPKVSDANPDESANTNPRELNKVEDEKEIDEVAKSLAELTDDDAPAETLNPSVDQNGIRIPLRIQHDALGPIIHYPSNNSPVEETLMDELFEAEIKSKHPMTSEDRVKWIAKKKQEILDQIKERNSEKRSNQRRTEADNRKIQEMKRDMEYEAEEKKFGMNNEEIQKRKAIRKAIREKRLAELNKTVQQTSAGGLRSLDDGKFQVNVKREAITQGQKRRSDARTEMRLKHEKEAQSDNSSATLSPGQRKKNQMVRKMEASKLNKEHEEERENEIREWRQTVNNVKTFMETRREIETAKRTQELSKRKKVREKKIKKAIQEHESREFEKNSKAGQRRAALDEIERNSTAIETQKKNTSQKDQKYLDTEGEGNKTSLSKPLDEGGENMVSSAASNKDATEEKEVIQSGGDVSTSDTKNSNIDKKDLSKKEEKEDQKNGTQKKEKTKLKSKKGKKSNDEISKLKKKKLEEEQEKMDIALEEQRENDREALKQSRLAKKKKEQEMAQRKKEEEETKRKEEKKRIREEHRLQIEKDREDREAEEEQMEEDERRVWGLQKWSALQEEARAERLARRSESNKNKQSSFRQTNSNFVGNNDDHHIAPKTRSPLTDGAISSFPVSNQLQEGIVNGLPPQRLQNNSLSSLNTALNAIPSSKEEVVLSAHSESSQSTPNLRRGIIASVIDPGFIAGDYGSSRTIEPKRHEQFF